LGELETSLHTYGPHGLEKALGIDYAGYTLNPRVAFVQAFDSASRGHDPSGKLDIFIEQGILEPLQDMSLVQAFAVKTDDLVFVGDITRGEVIIRTDKLGGFASVSIGGLTAYAAQQTQDPSAKRMGTLDQ
jgi:hypothetical protein